MTAKQTVLAKFPTANLVKSNISSWGVFVPHANRWLSYGEALPHLAWRAAAQSLVSAQSRSTKP